jgi:hypothetical protein
VRRDGPTTGDSLFLWHDDGLAGVAVCHYGPGTEAGSEVCYVKFGAVLPGPAAPQHFDRLLGACEEMTSDKGLARLVAGSTRRVTKPIAICLSVASGQIYRVW